MGDLLPFRGETSGRPDGPRVLDLADEASEEALSALSSETAREILQTVYEEPGTPPEIRDEVGTSLQNVHYHLDRLEEADLVREAGSGYSEKGTEMTVYAPASEGVVLFAGEQHQRTRIERALTRLLGAVGVLAAATLLLRTALERLLPADEGGAAAESTPAPAIESQDAGDTAYDAAQEGAQTAAESAGPLIEPWLAFFLGGLFMLVVVTAYLYWRNAR